MSAMPVEALLEDEVVIFLEPVVLQTLLQTVTQLPPGTPLVLRGRSSLGSDVVRRHRCYERSPPSDAHGRRAALRSSRASLPCERRVLVYLQTHLTLAEIGASLFVSRNTVKSQAISIYRKLGCCPAAQPCASQSKPTSRPLSCVRSLVPEVGSVPVDGARGQGVA